MGKKATVIMRTYPLVLLAMLLAALIYVWSSLKYPVLDNTYKIYWLLFAFITSILILVICQFCKHKTMRIIAVGLTVIYAVGCIAPLILALSNNIYELFPFVSRTQDYNNYCVFDKFVDLELTQDVNEYFPSEIPTVARDIEYEYYYVPNECPAVKVRVKFKVDKETELLLMNNINNNWMKTSNDNYSAYYDTNEPYYYKHIIFESDGNIEYLYLSFMSSKDAEFDDSFYSDEDYIMA